MYKDQWVMDNPAHQIDALLQSRTVEKGGQRYFRLSLEELEPPDNRYHSLSRKFVIPVKLSDGPVALQTQFQTASGMHQDSRSVAQPGQFIIISDPPEEILSELNNTCAAGIDAVLKVMRSRGLTNIYPAPADVMDSYKPVDAAQKPAEPGLYSIRNPRAVSRLDGPVMLDQTPQWGLNAQGLRNLQTQPHAVFIFELDENGKPLYLPGTSLPRARLYDMMPFLKEYSGSLPVPLVKLCGELAGLESAVNAHVMKLNQGTSLKWVPQP